MNAPFAISRLSYLRFSRKLIVVLVLASYLFAGVLHSVCDIDVTSGSANTFFTSIKNDAGKSDKAVFVSHHCHGCFSVSVPSPLTSAQAFESGSRPEVPELAVRGGLSPGIEPPPPKVLT